MLACVKVRRWQRCDWRDRPGIKFSFREHSAGLRIVAFGPDKSSLSEVAVCQLLIWLAAPVSNAVSTRVDATDSIHGKYSRADVPPSVTSNRFDSFAPQRSGNHVKWYVDGCGYFWALSEALDQAKESIWILGWWVSPELYLRRPPAAKEDYRLDRMLLRAAMRGVKINIVVYKEVTQVLTLDSSWTKHYLEGLHPNIVVFRHPDHLPDRKAVWTEFLEALKDMDMKFSYYLLVKLPGAALRALFGGSEETILLWAHHEKLVIIDRAIAFMGGLDLSFGRWDTYDHPLADVHPADPSQTVWTGQDYNNARVMDFVDVRQWQNSTVDRRYTPRMGWSDIALSLVGPVIEDLNAHFVERWNWIYKQKYKGRAKPLSASAPRAKMISPAAIKRPRFKNVPWRPCKGCPIRGPGQGQGRMDCQILRSAAKWSNGLSTEHSIMNAYIDAIENSKHFIYIENQFFITTSGDKMRKPVRNRIGQAIVDRIKRAHKLGDPFQIIVVMPAIPAFAGDLKSDVALGTRAIMEFQYYSIIRGGQSIYELLTNAGIDPTKYIKFYNLRNYDRINVSGAAQQRSRMSDTEEWVSPNPRSKVKRAMGGNNLDSITRCYMTPRTPLRSITWSGSPRSEMDAFVSEELYVHSKLMIVDDRIVIAGSANLNDRSQLGFRDSEIVAYIEDPATVLTKMAGKRFMANKFAASLRRFVTRKHLGLVPVQDYANGQKDSAFRPVSPGTPNDYDWNSAEDKLVADPLSDQFQALWKNTAQKNTAAFERVFRPVPSENIRAWKEYDAHYQRFYPQTTPKELHQVFDQAEKGGHPVDPDRPSTWKWGHVVAEDFPGGVRQVKEVLDEVRGTLVDMPLHFLIQEDIAKWGATLNPYTEQIYT
ncbi:hypothetical protein ANO11243_071580 [Dothideomycetidae sp. 11243]|nr:hypothetical protein ANO11243_071580 [fungal sp. No.11243]